MTMNINQLSKRYMRQQLFLTAAIFLVTLLVMRVWFLDGLLVPAIVSAGFTLLLGCVIGIVWRRIAMQAPDSLPTFFTAVSGFRLLLALLVMFIYWRTIPYSLLKCRTSLDASRQNNVKFAYTFRE